MEKKKKKKKCTRRREEVRGSGKRPSMCVAVGWVGVPRERQTDEDDDD